MYKVILLAVPGAGKSTILKRISERVENVKIVNFGDVMFEEARKIGIKSRDDMRRLVDSDTYVRIQEKAAESIGSIEGKVVVDTHAAVKTPKGYYPGLPPHVTQRIKPLSIIFLDFRPEDIVARRMKDNTAGVRRREHESLEEIDEHQRISLSYAVAASAYSSCYFVKFSLRYAETYPFQHVDDAASKLIHYLATLEGG
ncbi:MAG: adenylate kinase [Nitrososphaerota archaeon]|nr:adenylate kinase [Candidatus Calditenuaceae archaeon]MDW8072700.1 adenylate kinase [Nitrososphaerota archaeon]